MTCDRFRDLPLSTTSFSPDALLHLAGCATCRAYQKSLARQHRLARRLGTSPAPPATLRTRLLERLPETVSPSSSGSRSVMRPVLALAASAAIVAGVWVALPRVATRPAFATEVKSAVRRANTWHFVGWRREGNRKLRWEIWGRRRPFFYREQIGEDVLIDDGKARLRLLPPDQFQSRGYAITLPSRRLPMTGPATGTGPQEQFIEGIGGGYLDQLYEKRRNEREVVFSAISEGGVVREESLLTIDRQSRLPRRYRLERAEKPMLPSKRFAYSYAPPRNAAELTMFYNVAIPAEALRISRPARYASIDAADGLVLRPRANGPDAAGNLHVKIEHYLGGDRLVAGKISPWFRADVIWQSPPFTQLRDARYPTDGTGRRYLPISGPANVQDTDSTHIWLIPVDPVAPGTAPPRKLSLPIVAKLNFAKGIPDPYVKVIWTSVPILEKAMILSVPLPPLTATGSSKQPAYDNQPPTEGVHVSGQVMPLAFEAAMARYHYFQGEIPGRLGVAPRNAKEFARKALFWLERAIEAAENTPGAEERLKELREYANRLRSQL